MKETGNILKGILGWSWFILVILFSYLLPIATICLKLSLLFANFIHWVIMPSYQAHIKVSKINLTRFFLENKILTQHGNPIGTRSSLMHYAFRDNLTHLACFETFFNWLFPKTPQLRQLIWSSKSRMGEMFVFGIGKVLQALKWTFKPFIAPKPNLISS